MLFCVLEWEEQTMICMTTKETWETKNCMDDTCDAYGDEVNDFLESVGLGEEMEGIYSDYDESRDISEVVAILEKAGFTYCDDLGKNEFDDEMDDEGL